MTKLVRAGLLGAAMVLAIAPSAMASSVTVSGGSRVNVTSSGNERNQIQISFDPGAHLYTIADAAGITAHGTCTQVNPTTATCPGAGIGGITVSSSGGGDVVALDTSDPASVEATLNGGSGDDTLIGGPADDALDGSSGRDTLDGGPGADEMRGGSGADVASYAGRAAGVSVSVGSGNDDDGNAEDLSGNDRDTVRGDVETVAGSHGSDLLVGDSSGETLIGGDGDDVVAGQRGNDTLLGDAGSDFMLGGDGADTLRGWIGSDRMRGENGNDLLAGGPDGDLLEGGFGIDRLRGKGGADRLFARDATRDLKISCGPGPNLLERAKRDKRLDPPPRSC
jgi:Ca2+-binding RTX toxin-like protein